MNVNARLFSFARPVVMGILNVTDDSFFDGGRYVDDADIVRRAEQILADGAAIIDLGAVSTRPGAADVPEAEEWRRLERALSLITKHFPDAVISVDTWRSTVAERSVNAGAAIVNDISGGTFDPEMFATVGRLHVPYVLTHTTAKPDRMQQQTLGDEPLAEVLRFFGERIDALKQAGCVDIIVDPGFGFGKTLEQNYLLMENLPAFRIFGFPILVGISRKSMIYNLLKINPQSALNGTTVLNTVALRKGAAILRVHDVREAVEAMKLCEALSVHSPSQPALDDFSYSL